MRNVSIILLRINAMATRAIRAPPLGGDMARTLFGPIDQIGYVVTDLDAAVAGRMSGLGIGPWTIFRGSTLTGQYLGKPVEVTIDVALAYQGGVQIELIEQRSSGPSPYVDGVGPKLGAHHIAWLVDDLDAGIAAGGARGLAAIFVAGNDAVRVAYLEHPAEPDILYELIEGADMRAMIDAGIAATAGWDGAHPIVEIDMAGRA
jgi:methylmalonyl-CoA/ethylmalonyl-CoA epimerase